MGIGRLMSDTDVRRIDLMYGQKNNSEAIFDESKPEKKTHTKTLVVCRHFHPQNIPFAGTHPTTTGAVWLC